MKNVDVFRHFIDYYFITLRLEVFYWCYRKHGELADRRRVDLLILIKIEMLERRYLFGILAKYTCVKLVQFTCKHITYYVYVF